jgi:hypothetical protein
MLFSYCSMFNFQDLPDEIRVAQEKKLEELKRQQELQNQLVVQRTLQFRDRKIKFFGLLYFPFHFKFLFSACMECTYHLDVGVQNTKRDGRLRG